MRSARALQGSESIRSQINRQQAEVISLLRLSEITRIESRTCRLIKIALGGGGGGWESSIRVLASGCTLFWFLNNRWWKIEPFS